MRSALLTAAVVSVATAISAVPAAADILTFDGSICNGGNACTNFAVIDQIYGDTTGLDVIWDGNSPGNDGFSYWADAYSGMTNVAFGYDNGIEIYLKPLAGYQVTLLGFDIGSWPNIDRTSSVRVLSGDNGTIFTDTGDIRILGSEPTHFGYNATRADGFRIQFGPENYNVGIDNIEFRVSQIDGAVVPEPATWALMIGGFGLAGATLRRRRALAV